jgi:[acyl-carrier-protein] S-malonyltransferase
VAAGPAHLLDAFASAPPPGIRLARLSVAGAFHTDAMAPAVDEFARAVADADVTAATSPMVGNGDGALVRDPDDLRRRLLTQLTSPVRWDLCTATIATLAPSATHVELAPAGPLTRLLTRARPGARAVPLLTPADVAQVT